MMPSEANENNHDIDFDFELARAKVQLHYIKNNCFIDGEDILKQITTLKNKPVVIVQGRYDMVCPPKTAYEVAQKMPQAEVVIVPNAGHSASEDGTLDGLIKATEKFKSL